MLIRCCTAAGCLSAGSDLVVEQLQHAVQRTGQADRMRVARVGCLRLCGQGPLVHVMPDGAMYQKVTAGNAGSIVAGLHGGDVTAERLDTDSPFFRLQTSVVLENSGVIEPERIESYIAAHGYQALRKALCDMSTARAPRYLRSRAR